MFWSILADATKGVQQNESLSVWTLVFSGIAAACGIFSAVYTTTSARKKADRELLTNKLEMLFAELKDEITQTMKAVEIVDSEVKKGTSVSEIYENNVEAFRPIWSEANRGEILVSLYFDESTDSFTVFRENRSSIGRTFRHLSTAPFPSAATVALDSDLNRMADAYNVLRIEMSKIAKQICPRK